MSSQSEILFHEILDVQKILVVWIDFFFRTEIWAEQLKKHPVYNEWIDILSAQKVVQHAF